MGLDCNEIEWSRIIHFVCYMFSFFVHIRPKFCLFSVSKFDKFDNKPNRQNKKSKINFNDK